MSRTLNLRDEYFMSNNRLRFRNTRAPLKQHSKMKRFTQSFLYRLSRRDGEEPAKAGQDWVNRHLQYCRAKNPVVELGKLGSCSDLAEWCSRWQNE